MIYQKNTKSLILPLFILVISAFAIRVLAFHNTLMMNNDGPVYLFQAKALYNGFWQTINTCTIDYLTLYTILTAAVYPITGDLVNAAMIVNLIFGTLMIIPLYLFLRRFLDEKTSFLTTFIFAMLPLLVIQSVNIIRDPSCWFFSILGLYLLVYDDDRETPLFLIFSSLSFIIATATRIENIVFIICGCVYIFMVFKNRKAKAVLLFLSPIILAILSFIAVQLIRHPDNFYWYRFHEIPLYIIRLFDSYHDLEKNLTPIVLNPPSGIPVEFMRYSRTLIWFTALGVILQSAMEAFFYPFFFLLLLGMTGLRDRMRNDRRLLSFMMTTVICLVVLYIYCLNTWSMENRRLIMVIIPSAIFLGFGAETLIKWLYKRFGFSEFKSLVFLCLLVFVFTLPKNLRIQEQDKLVYKEIGETIACFDGRAGEIELITLGNSGRWIEYYANLHVLKVRCPDKYRSWRKNKSISGLNYKDFISNMRMLKIHYIIWEENHWPKDSFAFLKSIQPEDLKQLKEWRHHDTGRIILYQVLYPQNVLRRPEK
ncbi:hypothetical protein SMITH_313 [Smithella sp. ME-1]|uniref:Glycosyltransferase RgtA/B/C/D-like domain-containing protein n=1 Tax=hydrocarbon metagenome TaxID=938273 RepID=A0A0W8FNS5_9ZZZZ|nr:hypothetical protein SMITH_313 [Smithella sp. ME-1]